MTNDHGTVLKMTDYGATVVSLDVPDRHEKRANVVLGFPTIDGYLGDHPYFGATVGRYANRIARGEFTLDGKTFHLARNNGPNSLHGGTRGFNRYVWRAEMVTAPDGTGIRFSRVSPAGEEGYPGDLSVTATYILTQNDVVRIQYTATTTADTPINLTNHTYWNLAGAGHGDVLRHRLQVNADSYLPVDDTLIPTGDFAAVRGTPFDFTHLALIGQRLHEIPSKPVGYDHCYVLRGQSGRLEEAARVVEPGSGRVMDVWTTQPGLQVYSGNFLDGSAANGGYAQHTGFCLETQHYPDSPNQPNFPDTILRPGQTYQQTTEYRFSTD
jgi:aldose 1-epimerase